MASFVDKLRASAAAPVTAAAVALAGCAQPIETQDAPQNPATLDVKGTPHCMQDYPVSDPDKKSGAKPYVIKFKCGSTKLDYEDTMSGLANAVAWNFGRLPQRLEIEFNTGSRDAKRVDIDPKKLLELDKELAGRISPRKFQLILDADNADKSSAHTPFDPRLPIVVMIPARLVNTVPAEELRKDIATSGLIEQLKRERAPGKGQEI